MPLPAPEFDSRTYREILNESLARIPSHNPEWSNHSDSDPGITLLQLFAFMTESLIYRANRIPERNRMKFLRLLGIPLQSAQSAKGFVTFSPRPVRAIQHETIAPNLEVLAGQIPFRTERGVQVLPIEARIYVKKPIPARREADIDKIYRRLYASYDIEGQSLRYYETTAVELPDSGVTLPSIDLADPDDTVDGCLWLALLSRQGDDTQSAKIAIASKTLSLGVLPALDGDECTLRFEDTPGGDGPKLAFELPIPTADGIRYQAIPARTDVNLLLRPGLVELALPSLAELSYQESTNPLEAGTADQPPSLAESDDLPQLINWIRIRVADSGQQSRSGNQRFDTKISWVGINAAQVVQRTKVTAERLPQGTGQPDQVATLVNTPVLVDTVQLTVAGEAWQRIDDLSAAGSEVIVRSPRLASESLSSGASRGGYNNAPSSQSDAESKVYTVDRESGEIGFGSGARGYRPTVGVTIQASYEFGGGTAGMVGIGSIARAPALPNHIDVTNPVPTWGGDEGETLEEAEHRIPAVVRHRNRLVSIDDFLEVTWRTPGVDLARVEVLPLFHPSAPDASSEGVVTIVVIPKNDFDQPDAPRPDRLFLETVCQYLEPRRLITTELKIRGPEYIRIWISVGMHVAPGYDNALVRNQAQQAIRRFVSPIDGGFLDRGWPLGKDVEQAEVAAAVARVDGIAKVNQVYVADETGSGQPIVELRGLELPQIMAVSVTEGDPLTIEQLRGVIAVEPPNVFPVPVIPDEC